jgi:hypothetical protein
MACLLYSVEAVPEGYFARSAAARYPPEDARTRSRNETQGSTQRLDVLTRQRCSLHTKAAVGLGFG